jgi:hypothetical protein
MVCADEKKNERADVHADNTARQRKEASPRDIAGRHVEGHAATLKRCTRCLQDKVLKDYQRDSSTVAGRRTMCKLCKNSLARQKHVLGLKSSILEILASPFGHVSHF